MNTRQYYFDTLPLRPPPQPLESFTSYLARVAEANGKRRYSQVNPFIDEYRSISRFADFPLRSFGLLPAITLCSEAELLRTTFYHVGMKFGTVSDARWLPRFLAGVIASSLRYCPLCLQEALYYSLPWRFHLLTGCPKHACRLLERCGHCGCPVSIFPTPLRIGICPTCGGDLRECIFSALAEAEVQEVYVVSQELEFFLSPCPWETTEPVLREKLGQEFALLRYNKQLRQQDVSSLIELSMGTLEAIEIGKMSLSEGATLRSYIKYANYLEVPLSHIFIKALERKVEDLRMRTMRGKYFLASEDGVMKRVQDAVSQLEISGQRLTLKAVCAATGFSRKGLDKYERVKTFLGGILYYKKPPRHAAQDPLHEEQLLKKAQQAIQELAQAGKPITHRAVSSLIGISKGAIVRYPRVKQLVGDFVDYALQQQKHAEACEQALLEKVRMGVMELEDHQQPVTYDNIGQKIGIPSSVWLPYAQVRAFVSQHLDSRYLRAMKERELYEASLLTRVEEALGTLELAGKPVSFQTVGKVLGIDPATLKTYPRVHALIEQRKSRSRFRERQAGRSEEEVFAEVQRVILLLTERSMSVNYKAIAHEMGGISAQTLPTYPTVRMLVDEYLRSHQRYQLQEFALREEQLLRQMEAAITELEARGKPFTQSELCELVGMSRAGLRKYPRVNAFLEQKLTRHHGYQRRRMQPTEEELVQRVKEAIVELSDHGEHITLRKIARKVKITDAVLLQYPQVVLLLEEHGYHKLKPRSERAEELLTLVKDAINGCKASGEPITKERLSSMVGVDRAALLRYPEVRTLMTQAVTKDRQQRQDHRFQAREEELTQQVIAALQKFQDTNRRISPHAIGKVVHVSHLCSYYPNIKVLIEDAMQAQRITNETAVAS